MYLKRLQVHGFKSFALRTGLEFSPGITAVVGPNGSGKSNIADSLRWVLGEQNMRQLRGKRSEDIIFAGGHGRAPLGMAEVTLTLDNTSNWLPSEFSEVTVMRRAFRSGESDYLINGTKVRLKDVIALLNQARIGHDSYTIIGQGLVDQALSARAEERRGLFEDAAGIRQFQVQRNDAEQRLTLTHGNLSRLHDILTEIEPRLGPLAEQARRARDFITARAELDRTQREWYGIQWGMAQHQLETSAASETHTSTRVEALRGALTSQEVEQIALRERRTALLTTINELRRQRGEAMSHIQGLERDLAVAKERATSVERAQRDLSGEQATVRQSQSDLMSSIAQMEETLFGSEEAIDVTAEGIAVLESSLHRSRQEQEREDARLRGAQRDVMGAQARVTATQTELTRQHKQVTDRQMALATRRAQLEQVQSRADEAQARLDNMRVAHESQRIEMSDKQIEREAGAQEIAVTQADLEQQRAALADIQRERRSLVDRLKLLHEWSTANGDPTVALAVIEALPEDERPTVLGTIAQIVQTPAEYDVAVEAALGPFLHALVAASEDDAWRCAAILRASLTSRVMILWPAEGAASSGEDSRALTTLLGTQSEPVPALLHALLGTMRLHSGEADDLRWQLKDASIVTTNGEVAHPAGWLALGRPKTESGESVLSRARELRTLPESIEATDQAIQRGDERLAGLRTVLERQRDAQAARERDIKAREARLADGAKLLGQAQRETEKATSEAQVSGAVEQQLTAELLNLENEIAGAETRLAEAEALFYQHNATLEAVQEVAEVALATARMQQDDLAKRRTALAVQRQEQKALQQRLEMARVQVRDLETQLARRDERLAEMTQGSADVAAAIVRYTGELEEQRVIARGISAQLGAQEADAATIDRRLTELEKTQATERVELTQAETDFRRAALEAQRARDGIETLRAQMTEEMSEDDVRRIIEGDDTEEPPIALPPDEFAKMRKQIDNLRGRLKSLGGYDPEAPQAYDELKTRFEFLTTQVRDLEDASARLRAVIMELDSTMRRRFEETFQAVNTRFGVHFTTLFGGGAARLELTQPKRSAKESDDETAEEVPDPTIAKKTALGGIEVYVQIPGKKVQDLALLSGGERAMVSAALLFALLETNPPPFCLLDEVDAALDESNVVRFCEILQTVAHQTQFIVITHNRVTMTHASAIYGVSMTDSVSRILSMRLAENESASTLPRLQAGA